METQHRSRRQAGLKAAATKGPEKLRDAALKAADTKGPSERSRAAKMAAWTRKYGKDDATNPFSRTDADPGPTRD
jgi:hypothetical protein